jgi:20S proteasome alpha/beta subunit
VGGLSPWVGLLFLLMHLILSTMALKQHHAYFALFSSPGYEDIPWYSSSSYQSSVLETSRYEEFPPIIFSPQGRLHKVEAAVKASKLATPRSNVVIALKCRQGLLVVTTVPTSAFLNTSEIIVHGQATSSDTDQDIESHTEDEDGGSRHSSDENGARNHSSILSSPSLFLFDETCRTTTTSPIMLDGPLVQHDIVAATGGNAVDGKILRFNFLSLVTRAVQTVTGLEPVATNVDSDDVISEVLVARDLAHDMANMFQVGTQDLKKAKIRLLASSLVVLGQHEIWRVDPTGQFWNCHATVVGQDSDSIEQALFQMLMEKRGTKDDGDMVKKQSSYPNSNIQDVLESLPYEEALDVVKGCLESHFLSKIKKEGLLLGDSSTRSSSRTKVIPQVFWHAVLLDYSTNDDDGGGFAADDEKLKATRERGQKSRKRASKIVKRGSILLRPL